MSPIRMPFDISSAKKPRVSDMRGDSPLDVLDPHAGADGRLAPVFVGDRRRQLDLVPTRIEGVDDRRVLLRDVAPAHLASPRHLGDRKSTRLNSSHTVISYAVF